MARFTTPKEAKSCLAERLLQEASRRGVTLDTFERELIAGRVSDDAIERFEEREDGDTAERFWDKVGDLARGVLRAERSGPENGAFREAMQVSATEPDYLDSILSAEGIYKQPLSSVLGRNYRRWLLLGLLCVLGGVALAAFLLFVVP